MTQLGAGHRRYLRLLGFAEPPRADFESLRAIVRRHICRVPFENVSKLLLYGREARGRAFSLCEFLDGIEHFDLGGTCHSSNPLLAGLLRELGFDVDLIGCDMRRPNVHTSLHVRLDGAEYHADCGFGAPFLEPVAVARMPQEIAHGAYRYRFERGQDSVRLESWFDGEPGVGYRAHGPARPASFFEPVILDSYEPGRTFLSLLRVVRYFEDRSIELTDRRVVRHRGGESRVEELENMAALRRVLAEEFEMPRCPIEEAVGVLEQVSGRRFWAGDGKPSPALNA